MYCYYKRSVALPRGARVGLQYVIVVFPDHAYFLLIYHPVSKIKTLN